MLSSENIIASTQQDSMFFFVAVTGLALVAAEIDEDNYWNIIDIPEKCDTPMYLNKLRLSVDVFYKIWKYYVYLCGQLYGIKMC